MALCVSAVLLLNDNTDIEAYYIMLTEVIIKDEQRVPTLSRQFGLMLCLPAVCKPILVFICQHTTGAHGFISFFLSFFLFFVLIFCKICYCSLHWKICYNVFPNYFLALSSLHHLSCCGIKITSCTKPSSSATL